jgi:hypothetical protein
MPRSGKVWCTVVAAAGAALGFWTLDGVLRGVPAVSGGLALVWVWSRPDA